MYTKATERFRSRILLVPQGTSAATDAFLDATPGVMGITVRSLASMGNAADLTLSLQYADDEAGANAAAWPYDVPIYVNGVRQEDDAKAHAVTESTGSFVVDFCIDPATIPEGKFVGISYANSHASNMLAAELIEDVAYRPHASGPEQ